MDYKSANITPSLLNPKIQSDEDKYNPQQQDLPQLYLEISTAFHEKKPDEMIFLIDKLCKYILSIKILNIAEFQNILFPIITGLCRVADNESIALCGFTFINFIFENCIEYMPLLKEPQLFDFCLPFLNHPNIELVCLVFDIIIHFIQCQEDSRGRDYVCATLSVNCIIKQFIEIETDIDENNKLLIQSKALHLLRAYVVYPMNQADVFTIFNICTEYIGEGSYWHLTGNSLFILLTFLQQYKDFQEYVLEHPEFAMKIEKFAYSLNAEEIIHTLHILRFFIANNIEISPSFFNNFLTLLFHNDRSVCSAAMDALADMLSPDKTHYVIQLIESSFYDKLERIFSTQSYDIKYKAVEIASVLLKQATRILSDYIFLKNKYNILHCYFLFVELEDDSLSLFLLDYLSRVFSFHQYDSPVLFREIGDEESLISQIIESENQEIAEKAQIFYEKLLKPRLYVEEKNQPPETNKPNIYFGKKTRRRKIKTKREKEVTESSPKIKFRRPCLIESDPIYRRKKQMIEQSHHINEEDNENEY